MNCMYKHNTDENDQIQNKELTHHQIPVLWDLAW